MLVLTRRRDEAIVIGGDIKVTVVKMKGSAVLLGIEAPQAVTILRGELRDEKMTEPQAA
jgi:carbon storage regulator